MLSHSAGAAAGRSELILGNRPNWWKSGSQPKRALIGNLQYVLLFAISSVFKNVHFDALFTAGCRPRLFAVFLSFRPDGRSECKKQYFVNVDSFSCLFFCYKNAFHPLF